jgi:hypothetical protein
MARSSIVGGAPYPNFAVELGNRDSILPGAYLIEQGALAAVSSQTIGNLSLSATAAALITTALTATVAPITISATGNVAISASLDATIPDVLLSAAAAVIVSAALDASIGELALDAAATAVSSAGRDGVYPWWWHQYRRRIEAEREAERLRRETLAVAGDGVAILPALFGHGQGTHDPDAEIAEHLALLLPWLAAA